MFSKIDVFDIIRDHCKTLSNYNTKRILWGDVVSLFFIPLILAVIFFYLNVVIIEGLRNLLVTSLSIFAALLFNLLLLIYDIVKKGSSKDTLKNDFLEEIYKNISFTILLSIITVIFLVFATLLPQNTIFSRIIDSLSAYLIIVFVLTLLMILKRVHILLTHEFEQPNQ